MKRFWLWLTLFLLCANSLAAALYAGAPTLDGGTGFITFSPLIDCIFWGFLMAVFALLAGLSLRRGRPVPLNIPGFLGFPTAYLVTIAGLSVLVLGMGICRVMYQFSPVHLPMWGYIGLMSALYLLSGFYWGRRSKGKIWLALLWGMALTGLLCVMILSLLREQHIHETVWMDQIQAGSLFPGYTDKLLDSSLGGILARLNLPACVVMDNYAYAHYLPPVEGGLARRDTVSLLCCVFPPILFTVSWMLGGLFRPSKTK